MSNVPSRDVWNPFPPKLLFYYVKNLFSLSSAIVTWMERENFLDETLLEGEKEPENLKILFYFLLIFSTQ